MVGNGASNGLKLYATPGSGNSFKPSLALTQLGIPHRICLVNVLAGETRRPDFLAINPAGQVPYLVDADGFGIAESNAMLWYIAEGSNLMPGRAADRALMLQWMFFEQTRLEPNISPARFYTTILPHRERDFASDIPRWRTRAREALSFLNHFLSTSSFIVERHGYSIGDIAAFGYVHLAGDAGLDLADFPHVNRWVERVVNTPRFVPIGELLSDSAAHASATSAL